MNRARILRPMRRPRQSRNDTLWNEASFSVPHHHFLTISQLRCRPTGSYAAAVTVSMRVFSRLLRWHSRNEITCRSQVFVWRRSGGPRVTVRDTLCCPCYLIGHRIGKHPHQPDQIIKIFALPIGKFDHGYPLSRCIQRVCRRFSLRRDDGLAHSLVGRAGTPGD